MKVCFFGSYVKDNLTERLSSLLKQEGVSIIELHDDFNPLEQQIHVAKNNKLKFGLNLIRAYFNLWKQHRNVNYDLMIIPRRGIMTLPLAWILSKRPIIHFQYVPIYDSFINDRKKFQKNSFSGRLLRFIEKTSCKMSDIIVLDSFQAGLDMSSYYNLDEKKFRYFFSAPDVKKYPPLPIKKKNKIFNVFFSGTYIPFHGVDVIVNAAKLLSKYDDIQFTLCGNGQTFNENKQLAEKHNLKNIVFHGWVKFSVMQEYLKDADLCLGALGNNDKRNNSAPNKIFETLASKKPLLTRNTEVMSELSLIDNQNCFLIPGGDPNALAEKILFLKNNYSLLEKTATSGYDTFNKITKDSWKDFWKNTIQPLLSS